MDDQLFDQVAEEIRPRKRPALGRTNGNRMALSHGKGDYSTLDVVGWFQARQHYGRELDTGKHAVLCPWEHEHSSGKGATDNDTVVWEASGDQWPRFHCSHDHCAGRGLRAILALWGDADAFCARDFRPVHGTRATDDPSALVQELDWEPPIPLRHNQLPAFPTAALPYWLGAAVESVSRALQTPIDLAGMLCLAVAALALAKKIKVCVKPGWTVPVNLYTVSMLPSGERKSAVYAEMIGPVEEYERREVERMNPEIAAAASDHKIAQRRLEKAQSAATTAAPEEEPRLRAEASRLAEELEHMHVPAAPRLLADDITSERVAILLEQQGGRLAVISPEGGIFDLMAGRYTKNGTPNFEVYLKAYNGENLRVDRVTRPPVYVKGPALTIGLAVQPDVIRSLADKPGFRGRGLLARFVYAMPSSMLGHRDPSAPPVPNEVRDTYRHAILALLGLPFGTDEHGDRAAHILQLSPGARDLLQAFEGWLEPQLDEFGELSQMTDWAAKLAGTVARIAGILHVAERIEHAAPWTQALQVDTLERAVQLGHYLIPHARAAYAEMGADPVVDEARLLLAWMRRNEVTSFSKRDIFEGVKGRFKRVEEMELALALLISHHYIQQRPAPPRSGAGRRPSPIYDVNPLYAQNPHYSQNSGGDGSKANSANRTNTSYDPTATMDGPLQPGYIAPSTFDEPEDIEPDPDAWAAASGGSTSARS